MVSAPDSALSAAARARGVSVQPSIAISRFEARMPEIVEALREGRLSADGAILREGGVVSCIKASIEPVWHLPGIARRFKLDEEALRRKLFEHTGGMFPELVTRADLEIFLPPIGGCTVRQLWRRAPLLRAARLFTAARVNRSSSLETRRRSRTRRGLWSCGCTTSATAPTSSAPTSARAAPT